jgi:acetyl esterase
VDAWRESATTYEAADGAKLPMLVFEPAEGMPPAAGIVMFHGGALHAGSADGLAPHCQQLAARGILAVSAGYRLVGDGAAGIDDCVADVRRAVSHFQGLATRRGLGSSRLASGGSSAGAHLALVAAMIAPDPVVAAIVALNPVVDLLAYPAQERRRLEQEIARVPAGTLGQYSPIGFIRAGNPPILIQHGTLDETAPIGTVRRFRDAMIQAGNDCVLREYEGAQHAFHYPGPAGHFDNVIEVTSAFLLDRLAEET